MKYSEEQLRDFAMRVAWEMMDEEQRTQMMDMAKASLQVAEDLGTLWNLPPILSEEEDQHE